jgi:hypothetical protein
MWEADTLWSLQAGNQGRAIICPPPALLRNEGNRRLYAINARERNVEFGYNEETSHAEVCHIKDAVTMHLCYILAM